MIAFLDASALIYLVEGTPPFRDRVRQQVRDAIGLRPDTDSAVSRLSWLECRVRPARNRDARVLAAFDVFFAQPDLLWVELTKDVIELATAIRVLHGLRTPDALQAGCCLQLGPDHVFLTGDRTFGRVAGLNVKVLRGSAQ
ncbi:MAG TPA: PIN domain-containing protein [Burkholderiaceae bacterium]|jgi:predicted nucleic acid-binding protein|nr:PIN domain-containing protein [Burkholderiaceae bacterium]